MPSVNRIIHIKSNTLLVRIFIHYMKVGGRGDVTSFPFTYVGYFKIGPNMANIQSILVR